MAGPRKGAKVYIRSTGFVGIVQDGYVDRSTRLCEVWGLAHEWGSVYADDIVEISDEDFRERREELRRQYEAHGQW